MNLKGFTNNSVDFTKEKIAGNSNGNRETKLTENEPDTLYRGPTSYTVSKKYINTDTAGAVGRYFWINNNIRSLKKFEGDTIIESRFGQSIRFGAYDSDRKNDKGSYKDYTDPKKSKNPM